MAKSSNARQALLIVVDQEEIRSRSSRAGECSVQCVRLSVLKARSSVLRRLCRQRGVRERRATCDASVPARPRRRHHGSPYPLSPSHRSPGRTCCCTLLIIHQPPRLLEAAPTPTEPALPRSNLPIPSTHCEVSY